MEHIFQRCDLFEDGSANYLHFEVARAAAR
jgi:hypothetical protein